MEDDKLETEKIAENKYTEGVTQKLNKLDNSGPEIKTKKRLKSQGSDTTVIPEDSNGQSSQQANVVVNTTKKGAEPRKIKITQLTKKAKPTNIIGLTSGINSYRNDHDQGWEFLKLCTSAEISTLIEKKDMDVELIVGLFKIMSSKSTQDDYD